MSKVHAVRKRGWSKLPASFLVMLVAALTACHSGNGNEEGEKPVEVLLGAGTPYAQVSKAPVENGDLFEASVGGWESSAAVDYTSQASWQSSSWIEASVNPTAIGLTPRQYYSPDNSILTYIKAWYPKGELEAGVVAFSNDSAIIDVMLTPEPAVGSKLDADGKHLQFEHLTSQIRFKVLADQSLKPGTALRYIRIKNAALPTGIDLVNNLLIATPSGTDGINVPGIGGQDTITLTPMQVGDAVMVEPLRGNSIQLDVATSEAVYEGVTAVVTDSEFQPGTAYTITLTFRQGGISLTGSITPWKEEEGWGDIII